MKVLYASLNHPIRNEVEQDQKSFCILRSNQSGQALVEYILLLVIVVSLAIGAGKGFKALNVYLGKYIGDYTICLMEYGELPSLGVQSADVNKHAAGTGKSCNQQYQAFTFAEGRPYAGGGSGNGGQGGGSQNGSKNGSGRNGAGGNSASGKGAGKSGSEDSAAADGDGPGKGDKNGKGGNGKSPYTTGKISRAGDYGTNDGGEDAQKSRIIPLDEDEESSSRKKQSRNLSLIGGRTDYGGYHAVTGRMQEEYQKSIRNKMDRAPTSNVVVLGNGDSSILPYKHPFVQREVKKTAEVAEDNSKFSFGYFMRWILIAGMVLAIVVFFGGQIMNYSNSQD